ncbi:MAG TPA: universal stress protein [Solirubrobacteraceae bacterium]|nr:universal stress protein [Solirubrobacteraceae bacterium]
MYDNVVIGIDGRGGGQDAVALARVLAAPEAQLTLVHVRMHSPLRRGLDPEPGDFAPELHAGGPATTLLPETASSVGAGLERAAERLAADLVVVGACRHGGLTRRFGVDDSRATARAARSAVAVATPAYRRAAAPIRRIGVACDADPSSQIAMAHGGLLARRLGAELAALAVAEPHILTTPYGIPGVPAEHPGLEIAALRERLEDVAGPDVEIVYGVATEQLESFSARVDLLVCGSRRAGVLARLLGGSTSGWLIGHTHSPLLIAPRDDPAAIDAWQRERRRASA